MTQTNQVRDPMVAGICFIFAGLLLIVSGLVTIGPYFHPTPGLSFGTGPYYLTVVAVLIIAWRGFNRSMRLGFHHLEGGRY